MPTGHCGLWDGVGRSKPSKSMLAPRFAFLETLTVRVRALTCRGGTCLDTRGCGQLRRMLEQENWQSVAKHRQPYATAVNWNAVTFKSATKIDLTSLTYICSPVENKQAHIELSQERFAHSNPRSKSGIQTSARAQRTRRSFTVSGACALIYRMRLCRRRRTWLVISGIRRRCKLFLSFPPLSKGRSSELPLGPLLGNRLC